MQMMIDEFDYHPAYKRGFIRKWETADGRKRENLAYKRVPRSHTQVASRKARLQGASGPNHRVCTE